MIRASLQKLMTTMDANHDGLISFEEFSAYHTKIESPLSKSKQLMVAKFKSIDRDGSGSLDL